MRVRAVDSSHDWLFGKGQNDYRTRLAAVVQNIDTRLNSYLGDCFFDNGAGVDWFNFNGSKDQIGLNLAISAVILNTVDVTGINQLFVTVSAARVFTAQWDVQTSYGRASAAFSLDPNGV